MVDLSNEAMVPWGDWTRKQKAKFRKAGGVVQYYSHPDKRWKNKNTLDPRFWSSLSYRIKLDSDPKRVPIDESEPAESPRADTATMTPQDDKQGFDLSRPTSAQVLTFDFGAKYTEPDAKTEREFKFKGHTVSISEMAYAGLGYNGRPLYTGWLSVGEDEFAIDGLTEEGDIYFTDEEIAQAALEWLKTEGFLE